MTQDEIIRLAKEAGFEVDKNHDVWITDGYWFKEIKHFANLIIEAERKRKAWDARHWTEYEHDVAAAERESCAKMLSEEGWLMAATLVRIKK